MRGYVWAALAWAIVGAVAIVVPSAHAQLISPGTLTEDHRKVDDPLACNKCHETGRKLSAARCFDCHKELGARVQAGQGLHGAKYKGKDCGTCHIEHLGRSARLVKWPGGKRENFDHRDSGWALLGKHASTSCGECHTKKNSRGGTTYLGLQTACVRCHQDAHDGRFGTYCVQCHQETSWRDLELSKFNHNMTRFALKGSHQQVQCAACHKGTPPKYKPLEYASCSNCHQDPHQGRFKQSCSTCHSEESWTKIANIRQNHPGVSLARGHSNVKCETCHDRGNDVPPSEGGECADCHKPVHKAKFGRDCSGCHASIEWMGLPREIGLRSHSLTPFALRGKHETVECASCHKPSLPVGKRYRNLKYSTCNACHQDPHRGEFQARKGGECAPCHTENGFRPSKFDVSMHESTAFPLQGKHAAAPCGTCHTAPPPRYNFHLAKKVCADCHENPHGNQFAKEMAQGGCASCHNTTGWHNANIDHSTWLLTGAHATAPCGGCHSVSEADRKAGKVASYRGAPRTCEGCHEDVHKGQFRLSEPVVACESCHTTASYSIEKFDHTRKARYELTGGHQALACSACHKPESLKSGQTAVRYRLGYRECRDCHANPHVPRAAPAASAGSASGSVPNARSKPGGAK
jgi:hypothetical protein